MSDQVTHPSPDELSAFNLGQLSPETASQVEDHISECEPCCETLLGLASNDTFVALLKEAHQPADESDYATFVTENATRKTSDQPTVPETLTEHTRYEIVRLIGKGGMGDVFEARHRMMDRTVALKIINHEFIRKPQAVDRFHREVKAAARLSHPNIVTAYDAEQAGDLHFLVMEYVDGVDLSQRVKECGGLPVQETCDFIRQAAIGLQHAHEQGMVHRDIKPHNLMVSTDGIVKILDFGLASLAPGVLLDEETSEKSGELTAAGSIVGTPDFISPEQANNAHQADIRSDIYSLGATLYYLLSGRAPFADAGNVIEKLKSHAEQEPLPLGNLQIEVPAELADVIRKMMAKDPTDRYQTPQEVADALAQFVDEYRTARVAKTLATQSAGSGSRGGLRKLAWAAFFGFLCVLAGVFYVQLGKTTLKFEIADPSLQVRFGNEAIHFQTGEGASNTFTVRPGTRQEFVVEQNGVVLETDSLVLNRGDDVLLRIDVVEGEINIVPNQDILIDRIRKPDRDIEIVGEAQRKQSISGPHKSYYANSDTREAFEELIAAARSAETDEQWKSVVAGYTPMLAMLSQDAGRELLQVLAELPNEMHDSLLQNGYLKWNAADLDEERRQVMLDMLTAFSKNADVPDAQKESIDLAAYLQGSDVGFIVLNFPDSDAQAVTWYLLHREFATSSMMMLSGGTAKAVQQSFQPEVRQQIEDLNNKQYTDPPPIPVASQEIRDTLHALLQNLRASEVSDEQWQEFLAKYAPFLADSKPPNTISRGLIALLDSLPTETIDTLLERGSLKWPFAKLDAARQEQIRQIMRGVMSSVPAEQGDEKIVDLMLASLVTADVGFAVLKQPGSDKQFIAMFLQTPTAFSPPILPVIGDIKADYKELNTPAIKQQIEAIVKRPDSSLPKEKIKQADVAAADTRRQLNQLVAAAGSAETDDDWDRILTKHAPHLTVPKEGFEGESEQFGIEELAQMREGGLALVKLLMGLPGTVREDLLRAGYLKWRFTELDESRRMEMKAALTSILSASSKMGFPATLQEQVPELLASGDVGFAVTDTEGSQTLVWYLLMQEAPIPIMFPIFSSPRDSETSIFSRSVFNQLGELEDKPYSELLPLLKQTEMQRLQGTWKFVRSDKDSDPLAGPDYEIDGNVWMFKTPQTGQIGSRTTFEIDPSQSPKRITLKIPGPAVINMSGYYRFEGDELHISLGEPVRGSVFVVMRRETTSDRE